MLRGGRLVCIGGLTIGLAALATYPISASVATLADGIQLSPAAQATIVFDLHDRPVFTFFREDRTDVPLDRVSVQMVAAVLAIEDRRFYSHHGVDFVRVIGAAWADLRARRFVEGGSSITQQLVRLDALSRQRTISRKVREMLLATAIERRFGKSAILEAYLNRVYFGDGYYGIESAARGYFGKTAENLSPVEAATLAGLIKSPSAYAPREAPDRALARRNRVLRAMRDTGALTPEDARDLANTPLTVQLRDHDELRGEDDISGDDAFCGLYFKEEIRRLLLKRFGAKQLYQGGLQVYTTLDPDLQRAAEDSVNDRMGALAATKAFQKRDHQGTLEAGLIAIDPMNGYVLAMVGGRDFHESRFNRATQARRQPGSAFKPLLFAAALERGYSPGTVVDNLTNQIAATGGAWLPGDGHNQDADYTLRRALTVSSNRAAAQLMQTVGVYSTIDYAKRLGITSALPAVPSLALGTGELTLLELTSAYSAFANQGMRADPVFVRRVEDRSGTVLWETRVTTTRAVSPETAFLMSSMLTDVIQRGTASKARALGFTLPAAGKTGTTDNFQDAWFIGYTPHLVAGVWFGFDAPSRIMNEGFAATVAVPGWTMFMKRATANDKPDKFQPPPGVTRVTLCRLSGQLATDACRAAADPTKELLAAIESGVDPPVTPRPVRPAGVYEEYVVTGSVGPCELHAGAAAGVIGASDRSTQTVR
jgi:1A family penicillin-binding protein